MTYDIIKLTEQASNTEEQGKRTVIQEDGVYHEINDSTNGEPWPTVSERAEGTSWPTRGRCVVINHGRAG